MNTGRNNKITLDQIETRIRTALYYLTEDQALAKQPITMELLLEIRDFLNHSLTKERYEKLFPNAYQYDVSQSKEKTGSYYTEDGLRYRFTEKDYQFFMYEYTWPEEKAGIILQSGYPMSGRYNISLNGRYHVIRGNNEAVYFNEKKFHGVAGAYVEIRGGRYKYYYMNEIDHYFTHYIYKYVQQEEAGDGELGIRMIWEKDIPLELKEI